MDTNDIPQGIDDPIQVLLWDINELAPIMLGLVVGMITNQALMGMLVGAIISYGYRKVRDRYPDGFFIHMLYWIGVPLKKAITLPNPFIRRFIP